MGGTGLFVHSEVTYKIADDLILTFPGEIESTATEVSFQNKKNVLCLCVYWHPHMSINKVNEDYLDRFPPLFGKENKFCIIMDDFNINLLR